MIVLHRYQILQKGSDGQWYVYCKVCETEHGHDHHELMARSAANNHRWDCPGRNRKDRTA